MVHYATYYATFERIDMTPAYLSNFFQRDKLSEAGQIYVKMAKKKRADRNPTPVPTGLSQWRPLLSNGGHHVWGHRESTPPDSCCTSSETTRDMTFTGSLRRTNSLGTLIIVGTKSRTKNGIQQNFGAICLCHIRKPRISTH